MDVSVELWGGLVTDETTPDLPHGVSPDAQDCQFTVGSVKTRPGVVTLYTLPNNPTINYMKTYENLQEVPRFLNLDSLGNLRVDATPGGVLTLISNQILPNSYCKSCSLFAREYFAFSNGIDGTDIPRQYDDVNFDRVSQVGPGQAPTAVDEIATSAISAGPTGASQPPVRAVSSASEAGNIVTITTAISLAINPGFPIIVAGVGAGYNGTWTVIAADNIARTYTYAANSSGLAPLGAGGTAQYGISNFIFPTPLNLSVGDQVTVAGVGVAGYNGTWTVFLVISPTAIQVGPAGGTTGPPGGLAASGGGTITVQGVLDAGLHQVSVIFVTRNGYYTKPAPPTSWTSAGGRRVVVTNIPIGPPNVIARVLTFTAAAGASFYHLGPTGLTLPSSNMYIPDNTTTSWTVNFSDEVLLLGTLDDPLFNQIELAPSLGVIEYSDRLFWWGGQANLQSFNNLSFDGGFSGNVPLGWTLDAADGAGGTIASVPNTIFGFAYQINGNGATATRGKISQTASTNYLNNPIIRPNIGYTIAARVLKGGAVTLTTGTMRVDLFSPSVGVLGPGLAVTAAQAGTTSARFTGVLTLPQLAIPADTILRVYADGTPSNNGFFVIENIEIYNTNQQFENSTVRASKAQLNTQGQESYDSETGLLIYNLNDGQSVRSCFKIRERLYIVKEHSFGATQDDGANEPADWQILDITKKVGTPSVNGVAAGEDWVVIAHRTGLYLFWGGEPVKISQEIQPTWDTINWLYGYKVAVTVDTRNRRIFICAPFDDSTIPNKTLVLDYHDVGSTAEAIASSPPIHVTYSGIKKAFDKARKWCPWTIAANSVAQIEQSSLRTEVYFGSNNTSGNIVTLDDTGTIFVDGNTSQLLAQDNFARANAPLGAPDWSLYPPVGLPTGCQVLGGVCTSTTAGASASNLFVGTSIPEDQFIEITVGAVTGGNAVGVWGRTSNLAGYLLAFQGPLGAPVIVQLTYVVFPSTTVVLGFASPTINTGDRLRLTIIGSTLTVTLNGVVIITAIDTNLTSGPPGIYINTFSALADATVTNWEAGSAGGFIPSYYTTAFFVEQAQEEALKLGSHRKHFSYMTMFCQGQGLLGLTAYLGALTNAVALNPQVLSVAASKDIEMMMEQVIERMAIKVSNSAAGDYFDLQKLTLSCRPSPWSVVRGSN